MISDLNHLSLVTIKRNYLNFMEQTLTWFDSSLIRILFSLLMEKKPLTQEELIALTDLNRATVSDTLSKLTGSNSKFLVLQSRRKGERKKRYHCPQDLSVYFNSLLIEGLELTKISSEHIPEYLARLNALKNQNSDKTNFKRFLQDYQRVTTYFHVAVTFFQKNLSNYADNPSLIPDHIEKTLITDVSITNESNLNYLDRPNDSLDIIKRDFITSEASNQYATVGKRKELVTIGLLFFIEGKPITQNHISKITGFSRSTVSTTLSDLVQLNIIQVLKKPKDRKKYYESKYTLVENLLSTIRVMNQIFLKSKTVVNDQFLANIEDIKGLKEEKDKLKTFMIENIQFFDLFIDYTRACSDVVNKLLSEYAVSDPST